MPLKILAEVRLVRKLEGLLNLMPKGQYMAWGLKALQLEGLLNLMPKIFRNPG